MFKKSKNSQFFGSMGLIGATIIWGVSFVVVKDSTASIPVPYLVAFRYILASAGMLLLFSFKLKELTFKVIKQGAVLGLFLCIGQFFQTLGCKYTTAGKNAFITTAYVILVPFLCWIMEKKKPGSIQVVSAVIAIIGIGLLSLNGNMHIQSGDFLTVICGIMLGFHIIYIDRYTRETDPVLLTMIQFMFAAIYIWAIIGVTRMPFPTQVFHPELFTKIMYIGLASTMMGFLLQIVCQKYTNPSVAAVILSMESVFGMLFSVIILHEKFTIKILIGCVCMLIAVLLSELKGTQEEISV